MYELDKGFEGKPGDMLVHFPGLEQARWKHMADWLDLLDAQPGAWDRPLNQTAYWNSTRTFWGEYRSSLELVTVIGELRETDIMPGDNLHRAAKELQLELEMNADHVKSLARLRLGVYNEIKLARPM